MRCISAMKSFWIRVCACDEIETRQHGEEQRETDMSEIASRVI
jgi:hypothetical protein